jgi:hypothetical protein
MANYDDRLKDYVDVKERIRLFYEAHPDGRLVTAKVKLTTDPDRVWVHARAYRTADDPLPGDGWSWMLLPGTTPYTRGSEIENTETSAWGRAIGALGIGIGVSIASRDEVASKAEADEPEATETKGGETLELLGTLQKAGTVGKGSGKYQLEWRESPEGAAIGFRLKLPEKDIPQVLVVGELGTMLQLAHPDGASLDGHHVTVKGRLYAVRQTGRRTYNRLVIGERPDTHFIETPEARIPALIEAESVPMLPLDEDEKAAVGGGLPE